MRKLHRIAFEPKYPISICVSDVCWAAIVRWQKEHYGTAPEPSPAPLNELEDLETIGKIMSQPPEETEHMKP